MTQCIFEEHRNKNLKKRKPSLVINELSPAHTSLSVFFFYQPGEELSRKLWPAASPVHQGEILLGTR